MGMEKISAKKVLTSGSGTATVAPCGACKFLRRKCVNGCVFAPYFNPEEGPASFAAVHKVFGASNVAKLLLKVPPNRRYDAVVTICYESQARLSDPVFGCVSTIMSLQKQIASLQMELSTVQAQLLNSRIAISNIIHSSQQPQSSELQSVFTSNSNHLVKKNTLLSTSDLENMVPVARRLPSIPCSRRLLQEENDDDDDESANQTKFFNGCH